MEAVILQRQPGRNQMHLLGLATRMNGTLNNAPLAIPATNVNRAFLSTGARV
jgi:hypothetical protein